MPTTTVNVNFKGNDKGLLGLLENLDTSIKKLDSGLSTLNVKFQQFDNILSSISSKSGTLGSLNLPKIPNISGLTSVLPGASFGAGFKNLFTSALGGVGNFAKNIFGQVTSYALNAFSSTYKNIKGFFSNIDSLVKTFGNSIRQIAQGVQSFGLVFSIFVSAPLAKILQSITTEAVNFDDAMNTVRKTTGASADELKVLGDSITEISTRTPAARENLAAMAAAWGSMGVEIHNAADLSVMNQLVEKTEKLVGATVGLHEETVVEELGRMAVIYYSDINKFAENIDAIYSTIVEIARINPIDAGQLLSAAQRLAPVTAALNTPIEKMLALAGAVAAGSSSVERAATETSSALTKMVLNTDKIAKSFGMSQNAIEKLMSDDPLSFFLGLATSIAAVEDPTKRLAIATDMVGMTGAKSLLILVNSLPNLAKNLQVANDAFSQGTALQIAFAVSLESTKNQLAILRNNITYAGSAIGDALLPYITRFVTLAVPAIQILTTWFKSLSESVKIQVVAWGALLAVAGPIVVFFSSLLFMIGLGISGFSSLAGVIGSVFSGLLSFGGAIFSLLSPLNALAVALVGGAIYAAYLTRDLIASQNVIVDFVNRAFNWGYNLVASLASGISAAASAAYDALMAVINSFIGLIQSFSPPRTGPLKDIDKWGYNLIVAYADGMTSASGVVDDAATLIDEKLKAVLTGLSTVNFGVFDDIFNQIKSVISSVGAGLGLSQGDIQKNIKAAADSVANLMSNLQAGIPDDIKELFSMLGGLGGDFENLINLQLKYADGAKRLKEIETALKGINGETDTLIANVVAQEGLTGDQQSAMIRKIKQEQAAKQQQLEAEQNKLMNQQDQLKADIDKKQKIIDILASLIPDKPSDSGGGGGTDTKPDKPSKEKLGMEPIDLKPFDEVKDKLAGVSQKFKDTSASAKDFTEKLGAAKAMVTGFIAAVRGDNKADWGEQPKEFWQGWEYGDNVRIKVLAFMTAFNDAMTKISAINDVIKDAGLKFLLGLNEGSSGGSLNWDVITYMNNLAAAAYILGFVFGAIGAQIKSGFEAIFSDPDGKSKELSPFETAINRIIDAYKGFKDGWNQTTKDINWSTVTESLKIIGGAIATLLTSETTWTVIGTMIGTVLHTVTGLIDAFAALTLLLSAFFGADVKKQFEDFFRSMGANKAQADQFAEAGGKAYDTVHNLGVGFGDATEKMKSARDSINGITDALTIFESLGLSGLLWAYVFQPVFDAAYNYTTQIIDWLKNDPYSPLNLGSTMLSLLTTGKFPEPTKPMNQSEQKPDDKKNTGFEQVGASQAEQQIAGYTKYLKKKETTDAMSSEMVLSLDTAQMTATPLTTQTGQFWAVDLLSGLGGWFFSQTPVNTEMDKGSVAMDNWEVAEKTNINTKGETIAGDVTFGMGTIFGIDTSYFTTMMTTIGTWITDNAQMVKDKGSDIAGGIIDGMKSVLSAAGDALWGAISNALSYVFDKLPHWFKYLVGLDNNAKEKNGQNSQGRSLTSGNSIENTINKQQILSPTNSKSSSVVINVHVDSGTVSSLDARNIDKLANQIYGKMVKDMRLAGI